MGMTGGTLTPKQLKCIYALGRAGCMDSEELHGVVYTAAKKEHVSELTVEEARRVAHNYASSGTSRFSSG